MACRLLHLVGLFCLISLQSVAKVADMDQESCANVASQGHSLIQVKRIGDVPPAKLELASLSSRGVGSTAPLSVAGFDSVVAQCCTLEMAIFIQRLVESNGQGVCHVGGNVGMAHWYDCADDGKTFADLQASIAADSRAVKGPCAWIGNPADPNGCPAMAASCPVGTGTLSPCTPPPGSTTPQPPITCYETDINFGNTNNNDLTPTPQSLAAKDEIQCQAACAASAECTHFSFRTVKHAAGTTGCYMKKYPQSQTIQKFQVTGVISGPKKCP